MRRQPVVRPLFRLRFFCGYAGSIPVTRSIRLSPSRLPEGLGFPCLVAGVALVDAH
jgi:hypothetical protein